MQMKQCLRLTTLTSTPAAASLRAHRPGISPILTRTMTTFEAKKDLRKRIKHALTTLSQEEILRQSRQAQETVLSLAQYRNAQRVGIYLSMPNAETQTDLLVRDALGSSKEVFVPYIQGKRANSSLSMLRLTSLTEYESLEADNWGIPSLPTHRIEDRENAMGGKGPDSAIDDARSSEGAGAKDLDMIVMPGVAFDHGLNRLGHGRGYYDSFLASNCGTDRRKPFLGESDIPLNMNFKLSQNPVGLCLAEQLLPDGESIPTTELDWLVDALAVGTGRLLTMSDA